MTVIILLDDAQSYLRRLQPHLGCELCAVALLPSLPFLGSNLEQAKCPSTGAYKNRGETSLAKGLSRHIPLEIWLLLVIMRYISSVILHYF